MSKVYLLDSNCLITAKNSFYPFDFAPSFWEHIKKWIVTFETKSKDQCSKKNPQKRAKIPDVAHDLGADCIGLYEMMRDLHFKL
ncbi:DUF4411 family protein [Dubosiella newyorkensis]|uniref:DUF4411 family protein n=1 Tax=Dubosiella newyorkensis TaxID=1862672 RepID=UPI0023F04307|nr:DUF4411 family protein [Dubosiella newyorkensis]